MAIYSPGDLAKLLQVKEATVRKYSLLLEGVGYEFKRNASGQRWYEDKDVIALQKLVAFKHNGDMTLKAAAEAVFHWSKGETVAPGLPATQSATDSDKSDMTDDAPQSLKTLLQEQEKRYMQALQEMQQAQQERDKMLLDKISELQRQVIEQQKQLDAGAPDRAEINAGESPPQAAPEPKKGFWGRLFKN